MVKKTSFPILIGLLIASCAFAYYLSSYLPIRNAELPRLLYWDKVDIPETSEYFFFEPLGDELSQSILYHGLGDSIDNAREADILFIGNSRLNLGLRGEIIVSEAEKVGLKVFSLGCGFSEAHKFPMEVIRKHKLKPKVIVFTGGPWFYGEGVSKVAEDAMKISHWDAFKKRWEAVFVFNLTYRLHQLLPRIDIYGKNLYPTWIKYRSSNTGFLKVVREPVRRIPVSMEDEKRNYPKLIPTARKLKKELETDDILMVATLVPFSRTYSRHLLEMNQELGIPMVLPDFSGLTSGDGSHLDKRSARIYSGRFWHELVSDPVIRERLNL